MVAASAQGGFVDVGHGNGKSSLSRADPSAIRHPHSDPNGPPVVRTVLIRAAQGFEVQLFAARNPQRRPSRHRRESARRRRRPKQRSGGRRHPGRRRRDDRPPCRAARFRRPCRPKPRQGGWAVRSWSCELDGHNRVGVEAASVAHDHGELEPGVRFQSRGPRPSATVKCAAIPRRSRRDRLPADGRSGPRSRRCRRSSALTRPTAVPASCPLGHDEIGRRDNRRLVDVDQRDTDRRFELMAVRSR